MGEHYSFVEYFVEKKLHLLFVYFYSLDFIFLMWSLHFNVRALQKKELIIIKKIKEILFATHR